MLLAPRFICLVEPSGKWTVWDTLKDVPASLGGCQLTGREEQRAQAACNVLNRIDRTCPMPGYASYSLS